MKTKNFIIWLCLTATTVQFARAQGTLIYDQESSTDENYNIGGGAIQIAPVGQSFVPSLSMVGFVRLRLFDIETGNSLEANVAVNLRASAINGTILATSPVVSMTNGFYGSVNFVFANPISVTPGTTYYFDVAVQSGDNWGFMALGDTYPLGSFYSSGFPATGNDFWFREGIVVPEPSSATLILTGGILVVCMLRRVRKVEKITAWCE